MIKKFTNAKCLILTIVLLVLHMTLSTGYYAAWAMSQRKNNLNQSVSRREVTTDTKIQTLENKIKTLMNVLEKREKDATYKHTSNKKLKNLVKDIKKLDKDILKGFSKTKKKLKKQNISPEILKRHDQFVKQYKEKKESLLSGVNAIIGASKSSSLQSSKVKDLKKKIKEKWLPKKFNPLKDNDLPQKRPDFNPRKPEDYDSVTPAYEYSTSSQSTNKLNSLNSYQSKPKDLQETTEIQITPEIKELAQQLDHDPVKIYEYVKNNFDYEPYYGSVRGAQETLWQKAGNDFDQASLLISLYRASGIPARYVYGTVRVPIEQVKNWVGIEDAKTAASFFATNGVPSTAVMQGNEISYVEMEHTWVEAKVPVTNYRGASADENGKGWVPLDPSFKQYKRIEGVDLKEKVPFDAKGLMEKLEDNATIGTGGNSATNVDQELIKQKFEKHQQAVKNYLEENHPNASLEEILGGRKIKQQDYSILPLSLPYQVSSVNQEMAELDNSFRQQLSLEVKNSSGLKQCDYKGSIPDLASKRISLFYTAATKEDAELIKSYLPKEPADGEEINPEDLPDSLPAYLIDVKPQIRIDGKVVATGDPVTMGTKQDFYINFSYPTYVGDSSSKVHNKVTAGASYALTLDTGKISNQQLNDKMSKLKQMKKHLKEKNFNQLSPKELAGDMLHNIGISYFSELDMFNELLAKSTGVRSIRLTSTAVTAMDLKVSYIFGMPRNVSPGGLSIDVDRDIHSVLSITGNEEQRKNYNMVSGVISSYLEGDVFEQAFGSKGISTIHIFKCANRQGIPLYTINQDNINSVLPKLEYSEDKKHKFRDLVNNGKVITVPKKKVNIKGWNGTGYIVLNSDDGTGAYMISGGLSGGKLIDNLKDVIGESWLISLLTLISYKNLGPIGGYIYTLHDALTPNFMSYKKMLKLTSDQYNYIKDLEFVATCISYIGAATALLAITPFIPVGASFALGMGIATYFISSLIKAYKRTLLDIWTFFLRYYYCVNLNNKFKQIKV
ncbi:transglutaminase-like domain-containing protein [Sporohalobacter salinus]|uniref:transglutaminase-like domain-containing protein n=1 Tax=Sporohalobacter salinus TaxID=1494606 RepID=UPI00195F2E1A|nr:transglutaminase-like domain-containing protein [Sporohalobacter salinus]MBM7625050.1 hypothetical protein [Sporohalobacter salinus]